MSHYATLARASADKACLFYWIHRLLAYSHSLGDFQEENTWMPRVIVSPQWRLCSFLRRLDDLGGATEQKNSICFFYRYYRFDKSQVIVNETSTSKEDTARGRNQFSKWNLFLTVAVRRTAPLFLSLRAPLGRWLARRLLNNFLLRNSHVYFFVVLCYCTRTFVLVR